MLKRDDIRDSGGKKTDFTTTGQIMDSVVRAHRKKRRARGGAWPRHHVGRPHSLEMGRGEGACERDLDLKCSKFVDGGM